MIHFPVPEALTFDDVLLLPGLSDVVPANANTATKLSRNIDINIPIISAAMMTEVAKLRSSARRWLVLRCSLYPALR